MHNSKFSFQNTTFILAALAGFILNSSITNAQLILPQTSPKGSLSQIVGITEIKMEYHKPSVKGRVIWGNVVPYDSLWRTGANEATTISFSNDVSIEGHALKKGKYALYTIPGRNEWTIIFNNKKDMDGFYSYTKELDVLSLKVKPIDNNFMETLLFHINDITLESCTINLDWEKIRIPIKIKMDNDTKIMTYLKDMIHSEPDDAALYKSGAEYTLMSGLHMETGVQWAEMAINYKPDFENYKLRATLRNKLGNKEGALEDYTKALELAKDNKNYSSIKAKLEKSISELKENKTLK